MIDPEIAARYTDDPADVPALVESVERRLAWRLRHGFKICGSCEKALPVTGFGKDSSRLDGLDIRCRTCRRARG